ncbi:hypothetical protein Purlil1_1650 [Purpureocillium lilacinum]|uniref:Uncharacterized protein n=1 Tax=Purpureocillium lilacinum TaxID=33203 RepID=A0ABR0CCX1_PURLI|nr:hypothetical protein Purlil1_1650 [Purpureocillium lilacinum]
MPTRSSHTIQSKRSLCPVGPGSDQPKRRIFAPDMTSSASRTASSAHGVPLEALSKTMKSKWENYTGMMAAWRFPTMQASLSRKGRARAHPNAVPQASRLRIVAAPGRHPNLRRASRVDKDLVRHDHDPDEEYRARQRHGKHQMPRLACRTPNVSNSQARGARERLDAQAPRVLVEHLQVAVALHRAVGPPQLHRHHHQPDEPHDEEHKRPDHDNGRQQAPVGDEPEYPRDEQDREPADRDVVGKVPVRGPGQQAMPVPGQPSADRLSPCRRTGEGVLPRHRQLQLHLHLYKRGKDADDARRRQQHDKDPKVELPRRPVVRADVADDPSVVADGAAAQVRRDGHAAAVSALSVCLVGFDSGVLVVNRDESCRTLEPDSSCIARVLAVSRQQRPPPRGCCVSRRQWPQANAGDGVDVIKQSTRGQPARLARAAEAGGIGRAKHPTLGALRTQVPNARVAVPAVRPPPQVGRRAGWTGAGWRRRDWRADQCAVLRCTVAALSALLGRKCAPKFGPPSSLKPKAPLVVRCLLHGGAVEPPTGTSTRRGQAPYSTYLQYPKGATTNWIGVANVKGISSGSEGSSGVAGPRWSLSSTPPVVALRLYLVLSGSAVRAATRPACVVVGRVALGGCARVKQTARLRVGPPSRARRRQGSSWEKRPEGDGVRLGWAVAGACVFLLSKAWRCRDFDCERTAQPKVQVPGCRDTQPRALPLELDGASSHLHGRAPIRRPPVAQRTAGGFAVLAAAARRELASHHHDQHAAEAGLLGRAAARQGAHPEPEGTAAGTTQRTTRAAGVRSSAMHVGRSPRVVAETFDRVLDFTVCLLPSMATYFARPALLRRGPDAGNVDAETELKPVGPPALSPMR